MFSQTIFGSCFTKYWNCFWESVTQNSTFHFLRPKPIVPKRTWRHRICLESQTVQKCQKSCFFRKIVSNKSDNSEIYKGIFVKKWVFFWCVIFWLVHSEFLCLVSSKKRFQSWKNQLFKRVLSLQDFLKTWFSKIEFLWIFTEGLFSGIKKCDRKGSKLIIFNNWDATCQENEIRRIIRECARLRSQNQKSCFFLENVTFWIKFVEKHVFQSCILQDLNRKCTGSKGFRNSRIRVIFGAWIQTFRESLQVLDSERSRREQPPVSLRFLK